MINMDPDNQTSFKLRNRIKNEGDYGDGNLTRTPNILECTYMIYIQLVVVFGSLKVNE